MPRTPDPAPAPQGIRTVADFMHWLGDVSPERIYFRPPPGMANVNDVLRVERHENRLCDLICGVLARKLEDYFTAGVKLAWVIDLSSRTVTAYSSPTRSKTIRESGTLEGGRLLGGFKLPVRALFGHMGAKRRK